MKRSIAFLALGICLSLPPCARATITGQWDFNNSNLVATIGADLTYMGDTESATVFTTALIGGQTAVVMGFPACNSSQGYIMTHGIAPNGGGAYVNQYTLIMDVMFPASSAGKWRGLWQTQTANSNDGDLFVNTADGIGISGQYHGTIQPDTWHRVAFVFDLTLSANHLLKFIDGIQVGAQTLSSGLDGRWSLDPTALLFTDDDGETAPGFVNSIQIHDEALTAAQIFALGGPTAAGLPTTLPSLTNLVVTVTPTNQTAMAGMGATPFVAVALGTGTLTYQWYRNGVALPDQTTSALSFARLNFSDAGEYVVVVRNALQSVTSAPPAVLTVEAAPPTFVTGQWDFNQGDLRATVGQPLQFFDATVQNDTMFGTTTALGANPIAGQEANVMMCNPSTFGSGSWGGFIVPHGISPNGGGTKVNQYTVIMDLLYPGWTSGFFRGLWQTTVANTNDAEAFFNGANRLGISGQYDGELTLDEWHRVVLTFDLTRREFGKYIDGTNVLSQPVGAGPLGPHNVQYLSGSTNVEAGGSVDMRWALEPSALLLADDDGEVQAVYVSSVQVRSGRMTDADIAALGTPTANKIPIPAFLQARRVGGTVVIDWSGTALESAPSVTGAWSVVTGAAHPHVISAPTGSQFFRVRQ